MPKRPTIDMNEFSAREIGMTDQKRLPGEYVVVAGRYEGKSVFLLSDEQTGYYIIQGGDLISVNDGVEFR